MGYRAKPNVILKKNGKKMYNSGEYHLIHPSKYLGDAALIYWRSSWEYKLYFYYRIISG